MLEAHPLFSDPGTTTLQQFPYWKRGKRGKAGVERPKILDSQLPRLRRFIPARFGLFNRRTRRWGLLQFLHLARPNRFVRERCLLWQRS